MFCSFSLDCPVWPSCPETRSDYQAGLEVKDPFASDSVLPDVLLSLGFWDKTASLFLDLFMELVGQVLDL